MNFTLTSSASPTMLFQNQNWKEKTLKVVTLQNYDREHAPE